MAGMLSHDNIHRKQCDQLYFIGKAAPVLMNQPSPRMKFKSIYDSESEQPSPLQRCQKTFPSKCPLELQLNL